MKRAHIPNVKVQLVPHFLCNAGSFSKQKGAIFFTFLGYAARDKVGESDSPMI